MDARIHAIREEIARENADYESRLAGTQADFSYLRSEFDRIAPQLAALEQRFESLRHELSVAERDPDGILAQARREHERARLRLELVAHYEERLRRLEDENAP
ncbi:hypothetical protein [Microbacterium ulmi]|uniref:Uncharacterized protein n=1 Tax=Microbacterium ulmi TaxID=179095 RepID=A0A7Y2Q0M1_9MICO|nr:hypothetical protein [Microbacterium ulmi]NII70369.1 putative nucleic acid-binding Zn-ribbon protein [Microbacterium ulmi]NNH03417.1 hypothetical protein [Microbacterium ulmi]